MPVRNIHEIAINNLPPERANTILLDSLRQLGAYGKYHIPSPPGVLSARWAMYEFGHGLLSFWKSTPLEYQHMPENIPKSSSNFFRISFVKHGNIEVIQSGRGCVAHAGDCFLTHSATAFQLKALNNCEGTALILSSLIMKNWMPEPEAHTAEILSKNDNWGKALASILQALNEQSIFNLAVSPDSIIEQIACTTALAVGPNSSESNSYKQGVLRRLRQCMREHMHIRGLRPSDIATVQGMSLRTLHALFSETGASFCTELKLMRMERARRLLENFNFKRTTVAEISQMVGYSYPSHFIAHFRLLFGTSPGQYRLNKIRENDASEKKGKLVNFSKGLGRSP